METETVSSLTRSTRFGYLDNLRSLVIFLVIVTHSMVTYSGLGSWYYKEASFADLDVPSGILFGLYGSFSQAWFMGILFFLAAFFAARSLARRGTASFIRERLFRLGVPLLIYMFVVEPCIRYFILNEGGIQARLGFAQAYLGYPSSFEWLRATGPLWFAEALLFFSLIYAAWRAIRPAKKVQADPPKTLTLILLILVTGLAAFSIRLFLPIGTSILNLQFCFFAAYIVLFLLGVHAGERGWLERYPQRQGLRWFSIVFLAGIPMWFVITIASGAPEGKMTFTGGLNWQSLAYAFWESFVAIGFSVGLIAFFRKYLNVSNGFTRLLAQNSFAIYMFHAPVLIAISLLLRNWQAPYLLKHAAVVPLAFTATLAVSFLLLRRIPGLRAVLK